MALSYRRVVALVDAALVLGEAERNAFLRRECAGQTDLLAEVESLLEEEDALEGDFLGVPAALQVVDAMVAEGRLPSPDPGIGKNIEQPASVGPYRVLEELGRGGMGTVYLAEQSEPIERRIALKVIHGFEGERGTRRFAAECRALARLKHPNIAAVHDAGVTDDGRAFVAMEWVEGSHITDWCDRKGLSVRERIELFLGVCAGVGHAHQKGLVHRDLKPSNVLVAEVDGKATAKVIDFGIARTLDASDAPSSIELGVTEPALAESSEPEHGRRGAGGRSGLGVEHSRSLLAGSPTYMSPESVSRQEPADVDTRTDVYSLGILLYELLVGSPPFDVSELGIGGMLYRVQTVDAPLASTRWAGFDPVRQQGLADRRSVGSSALRRSLRGDLDAILAKATARQREARYGSVSELAADLVRYSSHRPVEARKASLGYQICRFVRRNLGAAIATALVIGVLVGGMATTAQEARRANREAERARRALVEAEKVSAFLIGLFETMDPDRGADDPESVDELLAKAEATMDQELADQPLARARFLQTIGRVAMNRMDLERAATLYEQALALREESGMDPHHSQIIRNIGSLGVIYRRQGREAEAETALVRAIELSEGADTKDPAHLSATLTWLANLHYHQKRLAEAAAGHRRALEIRRRQEPENLGAIAESLNNLSVALRDLGRYNEAKPILAEAESYFSRAFGAGHPWVVACWLNMAGIEEKLGHWPEAEELLQKAASAWLEAHGPHHHRTLLASRALGSLWIRWHRTDEAVAHLTELLEQQLTEPDADRKEIARTRVSLGVALGQKGDLDGAEQRLREAYEIYSELSGADHPSTVNVEVQLAMLTWKRGDAVRASESLRSLLRKRIEAFGDDHPQVATTQDYLGRVLLERGLLDEADEALTRALRIREAAHDGPSAAVGRSLLWLGRLRVEQGRPAEAARLLRRSVSLLEQVLPAEHPELQEARAEAELV